MTPGSTSFLPDRGTFTPDAIQEWRDVARRAAGSYGTPCYVTRLRPILDSLSVLESAADIRCWLSVKTHPLPSLVNWWIQSGRGVEVVSETELSTARRLGCSSDQLLVNGVAKHSWLGNHPI